MIANFSPQFHLHLVADLSALEPPMPCVQKFCFVEKVESGSIKGGWWDVEVPDGVVVGHDLQVGRIPGVVGAVDNGHVELP